MRIYEGDLTVRNILEDCRVQIGDSLGGARRRIVDGVDLDKLNQRLSTIPVEEIRRKRARMNVFYQEILVSADPDRGIAFTSCLFILAHYNIINDSKSLRLEEFLRRRARLQRVHDSIRRNIVIGFLDSMFWHRRFRRAQQDRRFSNLVGPPQLSVPEIFVEDDASDGGKSTEPHDFLRPGRTTSPLKDRASVSTTSSFNARGLPPIDTTLRRRDSAKSVSPPGSDRTASPTTNLSPSRLQAIDTSYVGAKRVTSPTHLDVGHSRQNSAVSAVSAQDVMESLESSAWGESIRRSFTVRRPRSASHRV